MRADIRLLGAILGDTVREQNGDEVFDLVERARVESFRVRRSEIDRAEMARMFDGIDIHLAIPIIRAFSHFALLANVAEDIHRERRRAIHVDAGEPPQDSSLAATYAKLDLAELDSATVAEALEGALVSPVITAHPTETRRRTVFVTQHRITQLMRLHAEGHSETDDGRDIETELRRQVLTLWQTALIRLSRLQISDEIAVGLRYYPAALFEVIPQGQRRGARSVAGPLARRRTARRAHPAARLVDRRRPRRQPERDRRRGPAGHRQRRLHRAGALPRRTHRTRAGAVDVGATGHRHRRSWPRWPTPARTSARADEPYRRALRVIRARLTATAEPDPGRRAATPARPGPAAATTTPDELLADLDTVDASLRTHGSALLADDRLARLREGVHVFGFHLCGLDMRQNSDVHEEVVAELLAWAGVHPDYAVAARRRAGRAAGRRIGHPPAADRRPRAIVRAGPQRT